MDISLLDKTLKNNHQPNFRMKQIIKAVFQDGIFDFSEMSALPKELREILNEEIKILPFEVLDVLISDDRSSYKALLKLKDNLLIETVLISPKPGYWSSCISSQAGCALGCKFCATGAAGFKRDLTFEEISSQVLFWKQYLRKNKIAGNFSNIVFMGMGEPFLNWENVKQSLKILTDKNLFGIGSRNISISTAGIVEGIERLAEEFPQVNLAISLHFADDKKRSKFMPINNKHNLAQLREAIKKYFQKTKRKVFIEYLMLDRINNQEKDADELIKFLNSIGPTKLLHVNLIRYNSVSGNLKPSSKTKVHEFKEYLLKKKINVTIRKSLGQEIQAACGQLSAGSQELS